MQPTLARPPFDRDGWVYEEKIDGWRMLAYKDGARVRLISRKGLDHTARFPDLAAAIAKLHASTLVLDGDGAAAWAAVQARGYEGLVAKDPTSTYREGPTRSWIKVKVRREDAFLVGGISTTEDGFAGALVGRRESGELRYLGRVEFGYSERLVGELLSSASGLARPTSPFADLRTRRGVAWLEPQLVAHVMYSEIVGGRLRAAVWRGLNTARTSPYRAKRSSNTITASTIAMVHASVAEPPRGRFGSTAVVSAVRIRSRK